MTACCNCKTRFQKCHPLFGQIFRLDSAGLRHLQLDQPRVQYGKAVPLPSRGWLSAAESTFLGAAEIIPLLLFACYEHCDRFLHCHNFDGTNWRNRLGFFVGFYERAIDKINFAAEVSVYRLFFKLDRSIPDSIAHSDIRVQTLPWVFQFFHPKKFYFWKGVISERISLFSRLCKIFL